MRAADVVVIVRPVFQLTEWCELKHLSHCAVHLWNSDCHCSKTISYCDSTCATTAIGYVVAALIKTPIKKLIIEF